VRACICMYACMQYQAVGLQQLIKTQETGLL